MPEPFRDTGIIFIHTPKAAGISIAESIYGKPVGHWRAVDVRRRAPALFARAWTFSVIRDPAERLYSAYEYLYNGGHPDVIWDTHAGRYLRQRYPTFADFCRGGLKDRAIMAYIHFWPQCMFFADRQGEVIVDDLYRFEELGRLQRDLRTALGREVTLGLKNKTQSPRHVAGAQQTAREYAAFQEVYRRDIDLYKKLRGETKDR